MYLAIFKSEILFSELELYSKVEIIMYFIEIMWNTSDEICRFTQLVHIFVMIWMYGLQFCGSWFGSYG